MNLLNHVKTGHYNTKKGISLKAIAVYIIYKSLSIFLDLWKGRNFERREAWVAFLTSNSRFDTDFLFSVQILHISVLKASWRNNYRTERNDYTWFMRQLSTEYWFYFLPFLRTYIKIVIRNHSFENHFGKLGKHDTSIFHKLFSIDISCNDKNLQIIVNMYLKMEKISDLYILKQRIIEIVRVLKNYLQSIWQLSI